MMKNINKVAVLCCFIWISNVIVSVMLFVYGRAGLYSGYIPEGKALNSNNCSMDDNYMLSYGPYHELRGGTYLVVLKYRTDAEGNTYKIYSDETSTLYEGVLDKNAAYRALLLKKRGLNLQVLTYYSGSGTLQTYGVMVVPVIMLLLSLFALFLILSSLFVKGKWLEVFNRLVQVITIVLVFSTMFYVDGSASLQKEGFILPLLFLANIMALLSFAWDKIQYRELLFLSCFAVCWITEWKNVINYGLDYMVLFLSGAIACTIFSLCYIAVKNTGRYCITMTLVSVLFVVYSTIQYAYYTYFKDFFTIKIVRLLFTAMEATASIEELIDGEVLSYVIAGGIYVLFVVFISLAYKFRQKAALEHLCQPSNLIKGEQQNETRID